MFSSRVWSFFSRVFSSLRVCPADSELSCTQISEQEAEGDTGSPLDVYMHTVQKPQAMAKSRETSL